MLKIRRPLGRLIFNMGIAIPGKTVFLIETAPCTLPFTPGMAVGPNCDNAIRLLLSLSLKLLMHGTAQDDSMTSRLTQNGLQLLWRLLSNFQLSWHVQNWDLIRIPCKKIGKFILYSFSISPTHIYSATFERVSSRAVKSRESSRPFWIILSDEITFPCWDSTVVLSFGSVEAISSHTS